MSCAAGNPDKESRYLSGIDSITCKLAGAA